MKSLSSVIALIALLGAGAVYAQSSNMPAQGGGSNPSMSAPSTSAPQRSAPARRGSRVSSTARENSITAELNRQQLAGANTQQAVSPPTNASATTGTTGTMAAPPANQQVQDPCSINSPNCATLQQSPAVNSPTQHRLFPNSGR